MRFKREGSVMSADLHGASVENARDLLLTWLDHAPQSVTELRVIHGYNRGTLLRDMVREELSYPRIKEKLPALNPGETRLVLRNMQKKTVKG